MKSRKIQVILAFAGMIHAFAPVGIGEQTPDRGSGFDRGVMMQPFAGTMLTSSATEMTGVRTLSLMSGILGLGLAIGAARDPDEDETDRESGLDVA